MAIEYTLLEIIEKLKDIYGKGHFFGKTIQTWQDGKIVVWEKQETEKPKGG